jgi:hypothetical protein
MRRRLHLGSQWRFVEGTAQAGMAPPEEQTHGAYTQDAASYGRQPGESLMRRPIQGEEKPQRKEKCDDQPEPDSHAESWITAGHMGERYYSNPKQEKKREMEQCVARHSLGNHPADGRAVSPQENLAKHARSMKGLSATEIDNQVPDSRDHPAYQSGQYAFTYRRMILAVHAALHGSYGIPFRRYSCSPTLVQDVSKVTPRASDWRRPSRDSREAGARKCRSR